MQDRVSGKAMDEDKAEAGTVVTGDITQTQTNADQLPILPAAGVITVGRRGTEHENALRFVRCQSRTHAIRGWAGIRDWYGKTVPVADPWMAWPCSVPDRKSVV